VKRNIAIKWGQYGTHVSEAAHIHLPSRHAASPRCSWQLPSSMKANCEYRIWNGTSQTAEKGRPSSLVADNSLR
jgi:hypothetical protein